MKTVWDLIVQWEIAKEELARRETAAKEVSDAMAKLDLRLKCLLLKHGPVAVGYQVYRAPADPEDAVIRETVKDAHNIHTEEQR